MTHYEREAAAKRLYGNQQVNKGMPDEPRLRESAWLCLPWQGKARFRRLAERLAIGALTPEDAPQWLADQLGVPQSLLPQAAVVLPAASGTQ